MSELSPTPSDQELVDRYHKIFQQTNILMGLFRADALPNPQQAHEYLQDTTFPFLRRASDGAILAYLKDFHPENIADMSALDARVAYAVFASMPDLTRSRFLEKGFSRRGILQPPQSPEEFKNRLVEVQAELALIANGSTSHSPEARLRAQAFFTVGTNLPLHQVVYPSL